MEFCSPDRNAGTGCHVCWEDPSQCEVQEELGLVEQWRWQVQSDCLLAPQGRALPLPGLCHLPSRLQRVPKWRHSGCGVKIPLLASQRPLARRMFHQGLRLSRLTQGEGAKQRAYSGSPLEIRMGGYKGSKDEMVEETAIGE